MPDEDRGRRIQTQEKQRAIGAQSKIWRPAAAQLARSRPRLSTSLTKEGLCPCCCMMWLAPQAVEAGSPARHRGEGAQCARRVAHDLCTSRRHDPHSVRVALLNINFKTFSPFQFFIHKYLQLINKVQVQEHFTFTFQISAPFSIRYLRTLLTY